MDWLNTTARRDENHLSWGFDVSYTRNFVINTLRLMQNGRHFPDDIFKCIFLNESIWISIEISLKLVPKGPINNIPALVQIMAWRQTGNKPLSEPMLVCSLTHICVTRPQWVNTWSTMGFHVISLATYKDIIWLTKGLWNHGWSEKLIHCATMS